MLDDITLSYMKKQTTFNNTNAYKYIKEKKRKEKKRKKETNKKICEEQKSCPKIVP